jgi:hypothetical protein
MDVRRLEGLDDEDADVFAMSLESPMVLALLESVYVVTALVVAFLVGRFARRADAEQVAALLGDDAKSCHP